MPKTHTLSIEDPLQDLIIFSRWTCDVPGTHHMDVSDRFGIPYRLIVEHETEGPFGQPILNGWTWEILGWSCDLEDPEVPLSMNDGISSSFVEAKGSAMGTLEMMLRDREKDIPWTGDGREKPEIEVVG